MQPGATEIVDKHEWQRRQEAAGPQVFAGVLGRAGTTLVIRDVAWTSQNANQWDLLLEKDTGHKQDCCHPINYTAPCWTVYFSNSVHYLCTLGVTEATPNGLKCTVAKVCYVNSDKATLSGQFQKPTQNLIFKDGKKALIWGWKSFGFVCPSTAGNYINVNQMLDLLTFRSCHVIQYIKRPKDRT